MNVDDIKAFIPSKDYQESKRFYQALGFNITFESVDVTEFTNGECSFFLQNFYHEGLADNLMLQLCVSSVDEVFESVEKLSGFDIRIKPPEKVGWGRVMYLWGPAGELWHITEFD